MLGAIFDKRDDPYMQPGTSYQVQRQLQTHSELQAHPAVQPRTPLHTPYRTMYLPYETHNAVDNRTWHIQNNGLEEQHMQQQGNMALHQQTLDSVKEMLERHENNMSLQLQKALDSVKEMLDQHGHMQQQQRKKKEKVPKPLCLPLLTPSVIDEFEQIIEDGYREVINYLVYLCGSNLRTVRSFRTRGWAVSQTRPFWPFGQKQGYWSRTRCRDEKHKHRKAIEEGDR